MLKNTAVITAAAVSALGLLTLGLAGKPSSTSGTWQVDTQHSDAQLITDATTDYGKTKIDYTAGFARVNGGLRLDADPANSKLDFRMYPATSMAPPIGEDGKVKASWLEDVANHTLICFHSKKLVRTAEGKLQATGYLTLTRVDRNVQAEPNEAYSGPVYGPPIIHHAVREVTFVFDLTPGSEHGQKDTSLTASGSTSMSREGFPELVRTIVETYWPPVVMDKDCQNAGGATEEYRGFRCTGTFMEASALPAGPNQTGEDYPGPSNFNAVVGNKLSILVRLRLTQSTSGGAAGR